MRARARTHTHTHIHERATTHAHTHTYTTHTETERNGYLHDHGAVLDVHGELVRVPAQIGGPCVGVDGAQEIVPAGQRRHLFSAAIQHSLNLPHTVCWLPQSAMCFVRNTMQRSGDLLSGQQTFRIHRACSQRFKMRNGCTPKQGKNAFNKFKHKQTNKNVSLDFILQYFVFRCTSLLTQVSNVSEEDAHVKSMVRY